MKWLQTIRETVTDTKKMLLGLMAGTAAVNSMPGVTPEAKAADAEHPNIIFILADDLGWTDINCRSLAKDANEIDGYAREIPGDPNSNYVYEIDPNIIANNSTYAEQYDSTFYRTPELSRLREQAMRFTNAHTACPRCKPTRVSIMTGKYPTRAGLPSNWFDPDNEMLSLAETTIAEALDNHGVDYNSAFMGKWHLSTKYAESPTNSLSGSNPEKYDPQNQGFEVNVGGSWYPCPFNPEIDDEINSSFWFNGIEFNDQDDFIPGYGLSPGLSERHSNYPDDNYSGNEDEYLTDRLNWEAVDFIKSAAGQDRPFFLYLSHYGPHVPTTAKQKMIDGYTAPVAHYRFDDAVQVKNYQNCKDYLIYGGNGFQNKYDGSFMGTYSIECQNASGDYDGKFSEYLKLIGNGYFIVDGHDNISLPGKSGDYSYKGVAGVDSRTVSAWIKTSDTNGTIIAWGTEEDPVENSKWQMRINDNGQLQVCLGENEVSTKETVNDDQWNHVAAVYDGSYVKLYINGEEKKSKQYTIDTNIGEYVRIGDFSNSNHDYFNGCIDEVSIYDTALEPNEIARISDANTSPHVDGVYAAMIESIDQGIGDIRKTLETLKIDDNTIIIFFSDNGGYGATSNYPLRGYKSQMYEGGNRVPLLVYWPDVTTGRLTSTVPVSSIDILPTILQMAYPDIDPDEHYYLDGKSLCGILKGEQNSIVRDSNSLFFENETVVLGTGIDDVGGVDSYDYKLIGYPDNANLYQIHEGSNEKILIERAEDKNPITSGTIFDVMQGWLGSFRDSLKVKRYRDTNENGDPYDDTPVLFDSITNAVNPNGLVDGDIVELPPCTFHESITINKDITLRSQNPDDPKIVAATIIDASYQGSVITATSNCTIGGITITNGKATNGGGINGGNNAVNLYKCRIVGNETTVSGGSVYNTTGTISHCTIENNVAAADGGGLSDCTGSISDCIISGNIANNGAGLYNCDGDITNCTIAHNYAKTSGGGLSDCTGSIRDCIIFGNEHNQLDLNNCNPPTNCCIEDWNGSGNSNIIPRFINIPEDIDLSGDNLDGIFAGDPVWTAGKGKIDGALKLNGTDDYVEMNNYKGVAGGSSRTCSAWIKTSDADNEAMILSWGEPQSREKWMFRVGGAGNLEVGVWAGYARGVKTIDDDNWHHVAAVLEDADENSVVEVEDIRLYVDGILEPVNDCTYVNGTLEIDTNTTTQKVLLGARIGGSTWDSYFDGLIDDVRIYSSALNESCIQDVRNDVYDTTTYLDAHWKLNEVVGCNVSDSSTNNYDGTVTKYNNGNPAPHPNPLWYHTICGQYTLLFDGEDDYLTVNNFSGITGNIERAVCVWMATNEVSQPLLSWGSSGAGGNTIFELGLDSDGYVTLDFGSDTVTGNQNLADGQWHHIVAVIDSLGNVTLYIDGDLEKSETLTINTNEGPCYIGKGISEAYFEGMMDDVLVFKRALSQDEIAKIKNQTEVSHDKLLIHYPFEEGSGTSTDNTSCSVLPVLDDSIYDLTGYIEYNNDGIKREILEIDPVNSYVIIDPPLVCPAQNDKMISYWNTEPENTRTYYGIVHNNVMWSDGVLDNCLNLTGDDYVEMDNYKGITGTSSRTCSAWIKTTTDQQSQILTWGNDSAGEKWMFRVEDDGTLGLGVWNGYSHTTNITVNDGQWHHVAVVMEDDGSLDISEVVFYVDGNSAGSSASNTQAITTAETENVSIGARKDDGVLSEFFLGQIDDVRIYSSVLSVTDVNNLYTFNNVVSTPEAHWAFNQSFGGSVLDSSGNNHTGTYFDTDDSSIPSKVIDESHVELDGDDYIEIAEYQGISGSSPRTCAAWIKIDSDFLDRGAILSWGESSPGKDWSFRTGSYWNDPLNSKLEVGVWDGVIRGSTSLNDPNWHHVAAVLPEKTDPNLSDILLYVDGIRESTTSYNYAGTPPTVDTGVNGNVLIGAELLYNLTCPYYSYYFSGDLDDVKIYSKALSDLEIFDLAQPTLARWKFDETDGATASDSSGNGFDGTLINGPVWQPTGGQINGALEFDGTDDYVEIPYVLNPAQTSFSAFAWVRLDGKSTSYQAILQQLDEDATHLGRTFLLRTADDKLQSSIGGSATVSTSTVFANEGQWVHVGVTYDGQTVKLYADGTLVRSSSKTAESCTGGLFIGRHKTDTATCWKGMIDDVQIYNRALSEDKVSELYLISP